jgi:hypothetical protein
MLEDSDGASEGGKLRQNHEYMNTQIAITHIIRSKDTTYIYSHSLTTCFTQRHVAI